MAAVKQGSTNGWNKDEKDMAQPWVSSKTVTPTKSKTTCCVRW